MFIACSLLLSCFASHVRAQCSGGIPASEVNGFLASHNRLRQSISSGNYVAKGRRMPSARIPIPNLSWDCGLERSAQSVASTCRFDHSDYSNYLGENLFMSGGSFYGQGTAASAAWQSEFQVYGWPGVRFTQTINDLGVGHATQMAWAKTTRMGCGMAACQGGRVIVVCHYRDSGNYIGQNVYEPAGAVGPSSDPQDDDGGSGITLGELFKNFFVALQSTKKSN